MSFPCTWAATKSNRLWVWGAGMLMETSTSPALRCTQTWRGCPGESPDALPLVSSWSRSESNKLWRNGLRNAGAASCPPSLLLSEIAAQWPACQQLRVVILLIITAEPPQWLYLPLPSVMPLPIPGSMLSASQSWGPLISPATSWASPHFISKGVRLRKVK